MGIDKETGREAGGGRPKTPGEIIGEAYRAKVAELQMTGAVSTGPSDSVVKERVSDEVLKLRERLANGTVILDEDDPIFIEMDLSGDAVPGGDVVSGADVGSGVDVAVGIDDTACSGDDCVGDSPMEN